MLNNNIFALFTNEDVRLSPTIWNFKFQIQVAIKGKRRACGHSVIRRGHLHSINYRSSQKPVYRYIVIGLPLHRDRFSVTS